MELALITVDYILFYLIKQLFAEKNIENANYICCHVRRNKRPCETQQWNQCSAAAKCVKQTFDSGTFSWNHFFELIHRLNRFSPNRPLLPRVCPASLHPSLLPPDKDVASEWDVCP